MSIRDTTLALASCIALAACGGSGRESNEASAPETLPTEAELARDAELANEAAADEAADMNNFGGSAAEMDRLNTN